MELWVHILRRAFGREDFVKTLKAVPQATIAAKRKLMRKYAPMLDWNCGLWRVRHELRRLPCTRRPLNSAR